MSANITSAYTIYTGTPGAGDWLIDCRLSGLAAGANTFTWKATVNSLTVNGAAEVLTKDTAETTMHVIIPIHCAASEAVVVTVLSSSGSDTAVTVSSTLNFVASNLAQWLGTAPLALSSQQVQAIVPDTQKVDVDTIKTRAIQDVGVGNTAYVGTVAFPSTWPASWPANWNWSTYAGTDTAGTTTLLARIPQIITMAQIGGAGAYYVEALTSNGAVIGTSTLAAGAKMDLADSLNATGVADLKTKLGTIPASGNWNVGKTGYSLAATGLDSITATEPSGKPTTFPGWLLWLVQRFRRSSKTPTTILVKTEAGATVTTQTITDDGAGTETLGAPS